MSDERLLKTFVRNYDRSPVLLKIQRTYPMSGAGFFVRFSFNVVSSSSSLRKSGCSTPFKFAGIIRMGRVEYSNNRSVIYFRSYRLNESCDSYRPTLSANCFIGFVVKRERECLPRKFVRSEFTERFRVTNERWSSATRFMCFKGRSWFLFRKDDKCSRHIA